MKLIFLSYINRSGSSFLSQKLSEYEEIIVFPEGDALIDYFLLNDKITKKNIATKISQLLKTDIKLKQWQFSEDDINKISEQPDKKQVFFSILKTFQQKNKKNAKYFFFKKRDAFVKINDLKKILPQVTFNLICLFRDPRAIFYSQKISIDPYKNKPFNINPLITAYYWQFFIEHSSCKKSIHILYEDFIKNTETSLKKIFSKLDILLSEKKENKNTYFDFLSTGYKRLHKDITKKQKQNSREKWKEGLTDTEIILIENECNNYMLNFGYKLVSSHKKQTANILFQKIYFKFRIFFKIDWY